MHSLKGGKFILLESDGSRGEVVKAKSKCFRIGSFLSCDLVLDNADAKDVHCDINCDAFGRIKITNHCKRNPVKVNGTIIKGTRTLYNNSKIEIFGKKFLWELNNKSVIAKRNNDQNSTPQNNNKRAEQAPNSAPTLRTTKHTTMKRITMHNLAQNQDLSTDSETDADEPNDAENQHNLKKLAVVSATTSSGVTPPRTPKPRTSGIKIRRQTIDCSTPVRVTSNQQNVSTTLSTNIIKNIITPKMKLLKCTQSPVNIVSYSPDVTTSETPKSINIVKSNGETPGSIYGTPNSVFSDVDGKVDNINLQSPKTPKPQNSMYLINLSTPQNIKTPVAAAQTIETPLLRSALKNSAKAKQLSQVKRKTRFSLLTEEYDPELSIRSTKALKDENYMLDSSPINRVKKSLQLESPTSSTPTVLPANQLFKESDQNHDIINQTPEKTPLKIVNLSEDQHSAVKALRASLLIKGKFDTPNKSSTPIGGNHRMRRGIQSPDVENVFEEVTLEGQESCNNENKNANSLKDTLKNISNTKDLNTSEKSISQINISETSRNTEKKNFIELNKNVSRYAKGRRLSLNKSLPDQRKPTFSRYSLNKTDINLAKKELILKTITNNKEPASSKLYATNTPLKTSQLQIDKLNLTSIRNEIKDSSISTKCTPLKRLSSCKTTTPLRRKSISEQNCLTTPRPRLLTNISRNSMNSNKSRRSLSMDSSVNKSQQKVTNISSSILQKTPVKQNNIPLSKRRQSVCLIKTPIKQYSNSDSISEKDRASTPLPKSGTLADKYRTPISANKSRRSLAMNTSINTSHQQLKNISSIKSQEIPVKESSTILTESPTKENVSILSPSTTEKENLSLKGSFTEISFEGSPKFNRNSILLAESKGEYSSPLGLPSKQRMSLTKSLLKENYSLSESSSVKQSENMLEPLEYTDQCTVQELNTRPDNLEDPDNNITNLTFSVDSDDDDDDNLNDFVDNNRVDVSSVTNQPNRSLGISRKSVYKNPENEKAVDYFENFIENIHRHDQIKESSESETSSDDNLDLDHYLVDNNEFPNSTPDISIRTEARLLEEDITDLPTEKSTTNANSSIREILESDDNLLNSPKRGGDVSNSIEGLYITPKDCDNSKKDLKTPVSAALSVARKTRRSCRNDLTNVVGVKELLKTPKNQKEPSLLGVRELLKTPKSSSIPETLVGVKELMKTPKNDIDNSDNIKGVRDLYNTPARDDITDVKGVKELMKTPVLRTPKLVGVKELMKTPKLIATNFVGVKELMKTPKPITTNLVGVKELMKTPKILTFAEEYDGLGNVFKTPASSMVMVLGSPKSANITRGDISSNNHLLKTPGDYDLQEDMVGFEPLFKTPVSKFMSNIENDMDSGESITSSSFEIKETTSTSIEANQSVNITRNAFDLLASTPEKPEISRTYSRTPGRRQSVFPIPFAETSESSQLPKTDIQKWVDNSSVAYKAVEEDKEEEDEEEEIYDVEDSVDSVIFTNQSMKSVIGNKIELPPTISSDKKIKIAGKTQGSENALNFSQVSGIAMIDDSTTDIAGNLIESSTPEPEEEPLVEEEEEELFIDLVEEEENTQKSDSNIEIILDSTTESSTCINISEQTNVSDVEYIDFISDGRPITRQSERQTPKEKSITAVQSEKKIDSSSSSIVSRLRGKSQTPLRNKVIKANARKTRAVSVKSTNEMEKYFTETNLLSQDRSLRSRSQTPYKKLPQSKAFDQKSIINVTSDDINVAHAVAKTPEKSKGGSSRQIMASTPVSTVLSKTQVGIDSSLKNFSTMPAVCLRRGRSLAPGAAIPVGGHREKKSRKTLGVTPNNNKSVNLRRGRSSSLYIMKPDTEYISNENTRVEKSFTSANIESEEMIATESYLKQNQRKSLRRTFNNESLNVKNIKETNDLSLDIQNVNQDSENSDVTHQPLMYPENNENLHQQDLSTSEDKKGKNVTESQIENNNRKSLTTDSTENLEIHHTENLNDKSLNNESNELVNEKDVTVVQSPLKQMEKSSINIENREKSFAESEDNTEIDENHHKMLEKMPTEIESEFKNFNAKPTKRTRTRGRSLSKFENMKDNVKISRKTLGHKPSDKDFDVVAAKEQYEMDLDFKDFEEKPTTLRKCGKSFTSSVVYTEIKMDSRKTLGQQPSESFDAENAKEQYELESQFKNFSEKPIKGIIRGKSLDNSENMKNSTKMSRKTLGHNPSDEDFDVESAKEQYEFECQFKNLSDLPNKGVRRGRSFINSEDQMQSSKVSRKTLGHKPSNEDFDVEAAKEQYEFECQFKNFSDLPNKGVRRGRSFVNSEDQVQTSKVSRKTLGHKPTDEDFDVEAAKEQYEFECQFKNLSDLPNKGVRRGRSFVNSEDQVQTSKVSRKTLGHKPTDEDFDVEAAKEQYEFECQFKNLSDLPNKGVRRGRSFVNSEDQVQTNKVARKTLGHKPSDEDFDVEAAKEQYEFECQFKNLSDLPNKGVRRGRSFVNSEDQVQNSKVSRKTMGHKPSDEDFDVEAAKEQYEFECEFKHLSDLPNKGVRRGRSFVNSEGQVKTSKVSRKTMGHKPSDEDFDVEAAKEQYEFECQFKNLSDLPNKGVRRGRSFVNSEDQVQTSKVARKTLGHKPSDEDFDVEAAKEQYEFECQFKNLSDVPNKGVRRGRSFVNSEDQVQNSKVSRKTMGHKPSDEDFDVEAAKEQYEFECEFKHLSDLPNKGVRRGRSFVNSEGQVKTSKVSRKTMGHKPSDEDFDVEAAKEQYEFECQFKNLSDLPNKGVRRGRSFVNSEGQVKTSKVSRRTMGHNPSDEDFDLEAAKEQYELESQFKNFTEQPTIHLTRGRSLELEVNKSKPELNKTRKTLGDHEGNSSFDINAAKKQYHIEGANLQRDSNKFSEQVEETSTSQSSISEPNLILEKSLSNISLEPDENICEVLHNLDESTSRKRHSDKLEVSIPMQPSSIVGNQNSQKLLSRAEANKENLSEVRTLSEPSPLQSIENQNKIKLNKSITPINSKKLGTSVPQEISDELSSLNAAETIDKSNALNNTEKENIVQDKVHQSQSRIMPARRKRRLYSEDIEYGNIVVPREIVRTYEVQIKDDSAQVVFKPQHAPSTKKTTRDKKINIHDEVLAQLSAIAEAREKIPDSEEILISNMQKNAVSKSDEKVKSVSSEVIEDEYSHIRGRRRDGRHKLSPEFPTSDTTKDIISVSEKQIASLFQSETEIQEKPLEEIGKKSCEVHSNTANDEESAQPVRRGGRKRVPPVKLQINVAPKTRTTGRGKKIEEPIITVVGYESNATYPSILKNKSPLENEDKDKKKVVFNEIVSQHTIPTEEGGVSPEKIVQQKERKRGRSTRGKNLSSSELLETKKSSESTIEITPKAPSTRKTGVRVKLSDLASSLSGTKEAEVVNEGKEEIAPDVIVPRQNRATRGKQTKEALPSEIDKEIIASTAQEPLEIPLSETETLPDEIENTPPKQKKTNLKSTKTRGRKSQKDKQEAKVIAVPPSDVKNDKTENEEEIVSNEKPFLKQDVNTESSKNEEEILSKKIDKKNDLKTASKRGRKLTEKTELQPVIDSEDAPSEIIEVTPQITERRPRRGRKAVESQNAASIENSATINHTDVVEFKTPQSTVKVLPRARRLRSNSMQQNSPVVLGNTSYCSFTSDVTPNDVVAKTKIGVNTSTPQSLNKLNVSNQASRVTRRLRSNSVTDCSVNEINNTMEDVIEPVIKRRGRKPTLIKSNKKEEPEVKNDLIDQEVIIVEDDSKFKEKDKIETDTEPTTTKPKRGIRRPRKISEEKDKTPEKKVVKRTRRGANQKSENSEIDTTNENYQSQPEALVSELQNGAIENSEKFAKEPEVPSEKSEDLAKEPEAPSKRPTRGKRKNYQEVEIEEVTKEAARPKRTRRKV